MQQQAAITQNKWFQPLAAVIVLLCISLYAFTNVYLFLAVPFAFMYMALITINWKTAYWVLLFCIPLSMNLEFFNGTLSTSVPDEPMMWLMLLLFGVLFAANPGILPKWWWRHPLVMIVFLQYIWLIVAVIYAEEHLISVKFLMAKTWFLVSFFVFPVLVFRDKKDFKTAFNVMLIPLLLTVVIIFYRHKQLGFNFRKIEKAIHNIYYNHVDYSTVISMFFPVLCAAYPLTRGMKTWKRLVLLGIIIFFLPAIYFTYARAAMIAVVFAAVIGIAIRLKLVNWVIPAFYSFVIGLILFLATHNNYMNYRPNFERTYMHANFADHMVATIRGQDMSSMERLYRWIAAVRMSKDRPWTGVGPNAFYMYYKPYAVTAFRTYVSRNTEHSTTHNYFLYMLVEQGWPALMLYTIFVFTVFFQAQRIYHRFSKAERFYKYCTLGVAMMFAAGFINNFFSELLETHKVGSLFYISVALLVVLDRKSRELQDVATVA
jgi:O-antigen ligase